VNLPVFSAEEAKLRDKVLAELTEHEKLALRHRERWLHRRRATDQLSVR
jgi:inosine/xanthosine triphosphate pyrophosphatase family protein